jgi:hypothetical protein
VDDRLSRIDLSRQPLGKALVALPVATPIPRCWRHSTLGANVIKNIAITHAPCVLAVRRFIRVIRQIEIAELMHLSVLHTAKAREIGFSQIIGDACITAIFDAVIDTARIELW